MSEILQAKLSGLRFKQAMTCITTGVSGAVAFIVLAMGCCMLLDWLLDFPYLLRVLLMFGYLVGLGYILMRYAIRPLINNTDDESLALVVERFHPTFSSRLIAAIQLSQPNAIAAGASPSLVVPWSLKPSAWPSHSILPAPSRWMNCSNSPVPPPWRSFWLSPRLCSRPIPSVRCSSGRCCLTFHFRAKPPRADYRQCHRRPRRSDHAGG